MKGKFHIKNYVRWISMTAVVMVVIGLVVVFAGFAAGGFKVNALAGLEDTVYSTDVVDGTKNVIDSIIVDADMAEITVSYSGTSDYELEYPSNRYSCETENGRIVISGSSKEYRRPWYQAFSVNTSFDEQVVLKLPKDFSGTVELHSNFGRIKMNDDFTFENLSLKSDNGKIQAGHLTVNGDVSLLSNFGSIEVEALTVSGDIQVNNDNGKISIKEMTGFGSADFTSNFGSIELYNTEGGLLSIKNDNGEVKLHGVSLKDQISVQSNFGSIRCDRVFAPDMSLYSDNGSIKGTIDGKENDFDISFAADIGSGSYSARGNGKYSIEAKTNFGSIDLDFSEK